MAEPGDSEGSRRWTAFVTWWKSGKASDLGHSGSLLIKEVSGHVFDQTRQQAADRMDELPGSGWAVPL